MWSIYTPWPLIVDLNIGTIFFLTLGCTGRCSHCAALVVLELDCPRLITLCLQVSFEVLLFQISCLLLVLYWLIKSGYSFCKFEQLEIDEALDSLHKELFKRYLLWLTRLTLCLQDCGIETEMLEHAVLGCTLLETLDVRSCLKVHLFALFELWSFVMKGQITSAENRPVTWKQQLLLNGFDHVTKIY